MRRASDINEAMRVAVAKALADRKGVMLKAPDEADYKAFRESQYDLLAAEMRKHLDVEAVYAMLREAAI